MLGLNGLSLWQPPSGGGGLISCIDPVLGDGFTYADQTLDLNFVEEVPETLDLNFVANTYQVLDNSVIGGAYDVWEPACRSLVLDFVAMDTSYQTDYSLLTEFTSGTYQVFENPPAIQGQYLVEAP